MFGNSERDARISKIESCCESINTCLVALLNRLEDLQKINEEAIINKETITKFINDLHNVVKIASVKEDNVSDKPKKKIGRPKKKL